MIEFDITILLASVVAGAAPIVLATLGETITEKAGVINLALDGTILLSAMTAFAVAYETDLLWLGFLSACAVGGLIALLVAVFSVHLKQSQVAVGFVLTLLAKDLAYFLGNPYSRLQGPQVLPQPVYGLNKIPFLGEVIFNHNWTVYFSLILVGLCWLYFYRTSLGLNLRAVGENPRAAFARGVDPKMVQLGYTVLGGILVGLAGATFSLSTKPGWGRPQGAEGTGWIALALVIFGGWHPVRVAIGAYLFALLQVSGIYLQSSFPAVPAQVFQVAPFPLMIFTLVLISLFQKESILHAGSKNSWLGHMISWFQFKPPAALGKQQVEE